MKNSSGDKMYFKEESINEIIELPQDKPLVEKILNTSVWPEVAEVKFVQTQKGMSYEGKFMTGNKILVQLKIKGKITYVSDDVRQSIHGTKFEVLRSMYVAVPSEKNNKKVVELFRSKRININPYIEGVYTKEISGNKIYMCMVIYTEANICV